MEPSALNWEREQAASYEFASAQGPHYEENIPVEPEHRVTIWCPYERPSGDSKWTVLCQRDGKYATHKFCNACKAKRKDRHA
jgi:hypothetical protein